MKWKTTLTVAYSQIYLEDIASEFQGYQPNWSKDELLQMVCVGPTSLVIGTAKSTVAPFFLETFEDEPKLLHNEWDHLIKCCIKIESGILVSGDFDSEREMLRVPLLKGVYAIIVGFRGLGTIAEDGLSGDDSYHAFIWPTDRSLGLQVLKKWEAK
jgi:hypothetical protein